MRKKITYNNIEIPTIIAGTFKHRNSEALQKIVKSCLENGIIGFDTAPSYHTEKLLGKILLECLSELQMSRQELFISTKIDAWQMQESGGKIEVYVEKVLKEMGFDYLDQLLIHWPIVEYFERTWSSFQDLHKAGIVRVIGISNVRERHILKIMDSDIKPMVVQNERHPLRNDKNVLEFCKENEIVYEAYSPVGQMMPSIRDSLILNRLAQKYDKSVGQVIMRWHFDTGSIPVFKTTKPERVKEYVELSSFSLDQSAVTAIDSMDIDYKLFLESVGCPGF